jgi:uncharacterized membrane protein
MEAATQGGTGQRTKSRPTVIDRLYFIGVIVKGIDAVVEFATGVILLLVPAFPHTVLEGLAGKVVMYPAPFGPGVATYLVGLDFDLLRSGSGILTAYLIAHGAIKVGLVYCLLRRLYRMYPVAIALLGLFLLLEIYLLFIAPTVILAIFSALDAGIIFLVWREYLEIRRNNAAARVAA